MTSHSILHDTLSLSALLVKKYLSDFSDSELLFRPTSNANHIAWQLGHLIISEFELRESVAPRSGPVLEDNFSRFHSRQNVRSDNPQEFMQKKHYTELFDQQRLATTTFLDSCSEETLQRTSPAKYSTYAPNVGSLLNTIGTHWIMHTGQFAVVRRALGKKILM